MDVIDKADIQVGDIVTYKFRDGDGKIQIKTIEITEDGIKFTDEVEILRVKELSDLK